MVKTKADMVWKMGGEQGEGIDSCGDILGSILAKMGYSLYTERLFASRIKGGHTTLSLRIALESVHVMREEVDILLALDQKTICLHGKEVCRGGYVICDAKVTPDFSSLKGLGIHTLALPITEIALKEGSLLMRNMVALGMSVALLSIPCEPFFAGIEERYGKKGKAIVSQNKKAFDAGYAAMQQELASRSYVGLQNPVHEPHMFLLGNHATSLGAMAAGAKFMASYPITPASEVMEYMIKHMQDTGSVVVQAEDEISSCMMAMGAGYGGVRAFTCTSGPGLSLMAESLSMASMAEIPVVIINVQRSGPSTGMATKVEHSDIQAACYNAHGDYANIVYVPISIEDSFYQVQVAFNMAEVFQTPVIFMPDLQQGLNKQTVPKFDVGRIVIERGKLLEETELEPLHQPEYFTRFSMQEDGISWRTVPGMRHGLFLSTGLEHNEEGKPAEDPMMHVKQMDKRFKKLEGVAEYCEPFWFEGEDANCDILLVGMGSTWGAIREASAHLRKDGFKVNHIQLRLIKPFPKKQILPYFKKTKRVVIFDLNKTGQLKQLFDVHMPNKRKIKGICKYEGTPYTVKEVVASVKEVL